MSRRILIVEDDPVSRDLIAALLATRGYEVATADDGFGALRMAQEQPYDLVFVDYHLPEMDGYALARLMRSLGEANGTALKMVAITADRFGLAARRGVDSIFDSVLAKPIEPDALFAFVEDFLGEEMATDALDAFLAEPTVDDAQNAASALWRMRGVDRLPAAAVMPSPSAVERERLEYCFRLVPPDAAECLLLLRAEGAGEIEALRAEGRNYLPPVFALEPGGADGAELLFQVGDGASWSAAAACLAGFRERRAALRPDAVTAVSLDQRLAAFLFVSGRPIRLQRDRFGRTVVPYGGGFAPTAVIEAVKRLAAQGVVAATPVATAEEDVRELAIALTARGMSTVARMTPAVQQPAG